jgi:hypothetical protein
MKTIVEGGMMRNSILWCMSVCLVVALALLSQTPVHAGTPTYWTTRLWAVGYGETGIGAYPGRADGWDGQGPIPFISDPDIYLLLYRAYGAEWGGETGFYAVDAESPIPSGTSKTWWDFYLWSNYTPSPPDQIEVRNMFEDGSDGPPAGYRGHLVIDQVAAGVTWTGPMDYWFDMTQFNTFILPIATVSDPLQGTRFHLTVYAPVPEPSSLAALALGAIPLAGALTRRRR